MRIYREFDGRPTKLSIVLFLFFLSSSTGISAEELARDELKGVVVDVKPTLRVEGTKKDEEVKLAVKLESKEFCLEQIYPRIWRRMLCCLISFLKLKSPYLVWASRLA